MFIFSIISPVSSQSGAEGAEADYRRWNENRGSTRQAGKFLCLLSTLCQRPRYNYDTAEYM